MGEVLRGIVQRGLNANAYTIVYARARVWKKTRIYIRDQPLAAPACLHQRALNAELCFTIRQSCERFTRVASSVTADFFD